MNTAYTRKFQTVPHTINFDNPWIIRLFMTQMISTVKNQQPTIADYRSLQIESRRYDTFTLLRRLKMILNSTIVSWNKESFEELKVIRVEIFSWKLNVTIIPIRWKLRSNPKSKKSITSCTSRKLSFATYAVSRDRGFTIDIDFIQFVSANYY